jgi:hypothetical protein
MSPPKASKSRPAASAYPVQKRLRSRNQGILMRLEFLLAKMRENRKIGVFDAG